MSVQDHLTFSELKDDEVEEIESAFQGIFEI